MNRMQKASRRPAARLACATLSGAASAKCRSKAFEIPAAIFGTGIDHRCRAPQNEMDLARAGFQVTPSDRC